MVDEENGRGMRDGLWKLMAEEEGDEKASKKPAYRQTISW